MSTLHAFRRATPADANIIRDITRAAYAKWVPLIGREPLPMTIDYSQAVIDHLIDLYEDGGRVVGLIEVVPQPTHLLIENIAVHPDQQGKGIGDLLLKRAEEIARSLQLPELQLYTNAAFAANVAFYASRGFQETARLPFKLGGETVYMNKTLKL